MIEGISCENVMEFLSQCRIGAMLLNGEKQILAINEEGKRLLGETEPGSQLREDLRPLLADHSENEYINTGFGEYIVKHPVPVPGDLPDGSVLVGFRCADAEYDSVIKTAVLNKMKEGVVLCDRMERLTYLNHAAAAIDSLVPDKVLGMKITDVYTMTDGSEAALPRVMKNGSPDLNIRQRYNTVGGDRVDIVANAWPLTEKGKILGAVNIVEDWRRIDELQKQIVDLQEKLSRYSKNTGGKSSALTAKYTFDDILYKSSTMGLVVEQCRQVAKTDSSVMIYGETGTGKELFAQSIHNASSRANGPFVAVNCAALPENLLESLLFGSVKGAYTGAENRAGLFEQANHGTLLLDEINSMNISLQAKLLRVLQEGRLRRVGGSQVISIDVRVLSNINVSPYEAIASNLLRQDLFYRLGVVNINIPPLRERKEDIPELIRFFMHRNNRKFMKHVRGIDDRTLEIFKNYRWPGNVRELQHALEHAMIVMPDHASEITSQYIPHRLLEEEREESREEPVKEIPVYNTAGSDIDHHLKDLEEDLIRKALAENRGNVTKTAKALNLSRQNLQYRIRKYGIDTEQIKRGL